MTRKKIGLTLFCIGAIYAFVAAIPLGAYVDTTIRGLTMDQLNQTMWAPTGLWLNLWGFAPPAGALVAGVGLLLYSGAGGPRIWAFGVGIAAAVVVGMALTNLGHIPPLFGIGGTVIVLSFLGILWFWAKERVTLADAAAATADLKLVGYVFFFIAAWFTCGVASGPFMRAFQDVAPMTPIYIMVCLAIGWFFMFLSHYQSRTPQGPAEA
jgi:hypothetical protein